MSPHSPSTRRRARLLSVITAVALAGAEALAGSYLQNFNAAALDSMALGDGSTITASAGSLTTGVKQVTEGNKALQLMQVPWGGATAAYKLPDLDPTKPIQSFDATFTVKMAGSGLPGAGWSLSFGALPSGNGNGDGGFAMTGGLTVAWDIFNNGGSDMPSIEVFCNGVSVGNSPRTFAYGETYRTVAIHWDFNGLDVTYDGAAIFTDLPTPGFVPLAGNKFAFSARNESSNMMDMFLDDLQVTTVIEQPVETGGPVISEFMADNSGTLEDEDTDAPDWIEIYNGQNLTVNLSGWRLTNAPGNNTLWTFPSVSVGPYGYLIVYASGKNRTTNPALLHTNFTMQKEAGFLALIKADGTTVASQFSYGPQYQDVSYGEKGQTRTLGFLQPASPGAKSSLSTVQAPGGPAEDVVWSRDGGIITAAAPAAVTISTPLAPGAVVRYTTNNTEPGASSPLYTTAFNVTATTTFRARVFTPNMLPGPVSSRTFLLIDGSLTNYNGSGQPFSTNVPIVVLESFGVPVDSYTATNQRDYRLTYAVVIAPNPATGRATITDPPDFQGRSGIHVRGESSAGFPQRQYSWELWDNSNNDKSASILGMPSESDWVLYAPWSDKSLMRDVLTFGTMRKLRSDYMAARTKYCEVLFNQTAGAAVGYGGSYKGVYVIKEKLKTGKDRVDVAKLNSLTATAPNVTGGYIFRKDKTDPDSTGWTSATFGIPLLSYDPDLLTTPQLTSLQGYVNSFEAALNGAGFADPATGYAAWMEADTFIDAQWFVEWTKQVDGYVFSTYFHKDRNGKLRGGPVWDFNISLGNADYATGDTPTGWLYDTAGTATGTGSLWYPRLHQDPWYRLRHFDRYWEMRRGLLATASILADIDGYASTMLNGSATAVGNSMAALPPAQENPAMRQFRLFPRLGIYDWPNGPGYATRTTYQSEVGYMKTWLTTRLAWLDEQNFTGTVIYRPPNLSSYGGSVGAGTLLTMSAYTGTPPATFTYATGTIYYTTNGSDPRGAGGVIAGTAYSGAITLNASQTVKARLYNAGNWSPVSTAGFVVNAVPASAANLAVSEIMYHPADATLAETTAGYGSNDFEYLELLNVGVTDVDLSNVALTNGVLFNFGTSNPTLLTLPPGGSIIVAGNVNAFLLRYGNNPAVRVAGAYAGNLSNSGEQVIVTGATGATIAQFTYGTAEPWPADADGVGYSLVLNNPAPSLGSAYYNDGTHWRSSGLVKGTPGLANSTPFTGSPTGDTDGDGVSDFFEYATGSNMGSAASRNVPVTSVAPFTVGNVTQNYLKLDYRRNLAADGVQYTVRYSTDLSNWVSDASAVTYVGTHNNGDGTATVTCRTTQPADAAHPRMFLKLSVTP